MYLERLELQGFKTFAKKTTLNFPKLANNHALTVIVGPNGSGKSNLSDAIRWCLGEQSMKHLRGKKAEDIIFSGSEGKGRSGFAEVTMTLNNEDKSLKVDYTEVTITRRLYRDGNSEYLLNGKKCRLADIQLLLAEAGIGQRTYTVVGQGMIDHVLTSSPEERKVFFDDATGVRGLQIKRHQSMLKLRKASENLVEVELLVNEIEPRLRSLKRQVSRLEKREGIEKELHALQEVYYQTVWWRLQKELDIYQGKINEAHALVIKKQQELTKGDKELEEIEKAAGAHEHQDNSAIQEAQKEYKDAQNALAEVRKKQFEAERALELEKVKAQTNWSPLPLDEILKELEAILRESTSSNVEKVIKMIRTLRDKLKKPSPDDFKPDPKMVAEIADAKTAVQKAQEQIKQIEQKIDELNKASQSSKTEVFAFQRKLRQVQAELYKLEQAENELKIDVARIETRMESLQNEMQEEIPQTIETVKTQQAEQPLQNPEEARSKILRFKHELELIGGIDEETITEYEETKERYEFLSGQLTDIREAIKSTEKIIDDLDQQISSQSEKAFKQINKEFQKYFKILFGGGSCSLIQLTAEETKHAAEDDSHVALDRAMEQLAEDRIEENSDSVEEILKRVKQRKDRVAGIDIQATPPGKKLKALNLLSGGERALTSIALLSAIMATNPSPFIVLDEVDAALDEANTVRFATILNELRKLTQFVVISHNRATMERADLLYGVTMGNDGISNLLTVNIQDIEDQITARR